MCTDEVLNMNEVDVRMEPVPFTVNLSMEPEPLAVRLTEWLKCEDVTSLLAAKKIVEEILAKRIQQEIAIMRDNTAAIAEATQQPIEQVVESLMPKAGRGRKLAVVEAPKPERVKYRHPENAELTWTGRGKQPGWLRAALEQYDEQDLLAA